MSVFPKGESPEHATSMRHLEQEDQTTAPTKKTQPTTKNHSFSPRDLNQKLNLLALGLIIAE